MKSLFELYREHQGKVSDKWSIYLSEYDRIFSPYREQPVRMLEIGIQNGGSLEVWSKYFPNAQVFVGCDINPDCARLVYEDFRINVVVGDANTGTSETEILSRSPCFDLIIDDGSHTSADIVKSFARYFRHLNYGGVFVAEDLHCSYWKSFEGGLYYPYSSIAFFKRLADVVNHEHWGVEKERRQLLQGFSEQFSTEFDESTLAEVHSIEFFNSVCVVHKCKAQSNVLGERFIAGQNELVVSGHHGLTGCFSTPKSQSGNHWAAMKSAPEESWEELTQLLPERDSQIASLNQAVAEHAGQIASLSGAVTEREGQIASLNQAVTERDSQIASLNQAVAEHAGQIASLSQAVAERDDRIAVNHSVVMRRDDTINALGNLVAERDRIIQETYRSHSWQLTKPIRFLSRTARKVLNFSLNFKPSKINFIYKLAKPHLKTVIRNPGRLKSKLHFFNIAWQSDGYRGVIRQLQQTSVKSSTISKPINKISVIDVMQKLAHIPHDLKPTDSFYSMAKTAFCYRNDSRPVVLFISHTYGGGTEKHVIELAEALSKNNARILLLRPFAGENGCDVTLEIFKSETLKVELSSQSIDLLAGVIKAFAVSKVHVHHTIGFEFSIEELLIAIDLSYDVSIHDYYSICPLINLRTINKGYCGSPTTDDCNACLALEPARAGGIEIIWWRAKYASLLNGANAVYCPSHDTAKRIAEHYPTAPLKVVLHEDINLPNVRYATEARTTRRIAILGVLASHKGLSLVEDALIIIEKKELPIEFALIGYPEREISNSKALTQTGPYVDSELHLLIEKIDPDVILFPAQCPETYSYTLTAAILSGRPIAVTNLGSLPERVKNISNTFVYPYEYTAVELVEYLLTLNLSQNGSDEQKRDTISYG